MSKFDDEYVENLSVEELLLAAFSRVIENEDSSNIDKQLTRVRHQLEDIYTRLSEQDKKIEAVTIGQWIEARLQALEYKEVELRRVLTYLELHYQLDRE